MLCSSCSCAFLKPGSTIRAAVTLAWLVGVSVVVLPDISRHQMYPSSVQQIEREN